MANPQSNTKVENVTEAIENLVVAVNVALKEPPPRNAYVSVKAAREEMAGALRELLQPTLRVVGGRDTPTMPYVDDKAKRIVYPPNWPPKKQ
jgi:thioredoxin-related protein